MESKDRNRIQQEILQKYPGTDPEIDIDWDMVEIAFKAGQEKVVEWINANKLPYECEDCGILSGDEWPASDDWKDQLEEWGL